VLLEFDYPSANLYLHINSDRFKLKKFMCCLLV